MKPQMRLHSSDSYTSFYLLQVWEKRNLLRYHSNSSDSLERQNQFQYWALDSENDSAHSESWFLCLVNSTFYDLGWCFLRFVLKVLRFRTLICALTTEMSSGFGWSKAVLACLLFAHPYQEPFSSPQWSYFQTELIQTHQQGSFCSKRP